MAVAVNETGEALRLDESGQWVPTKVAKHPQTGDMLALDGSEWKPVKMPGATGMRGGATAEAASAATFGLADYAGALSGPVGNAARAAFGQEEFDPAGAYTKRFAEIRADREAYREENPGKAIAAQVAGGFAAVAPTANLLARGIRAVAPNAPRAVNYLAGVGAGAVEGGIYGATEAKPGENVEGAAKGAAAGVVAGATLPGLIFGAQTAWNKAVVPVARKLMDRFGRGPATAAQRKLVEALQRDGLNPQQISQRLLDMGPEATIADAGGENVRLLAESAANQPGRARELATQALEGRQGGQGDRLYDAAQRGLQARGDFHGQLDDLMAQRAQDAAPLYERAFALRAWSPRLQEFIDDPIIQQGIRRGLEVQRLESLARGQPFNPRDYNVTGFNEAGEPIIGQTPNLRLMDAAKRGLDEIIDAARDGTTGRVQWTQRLRAVDEVRRSLLREMDGLTNGAYAEARAAWAGPSAARDALMRGRGFARGDHEITARVVSDMAPSEREMFREGVLREIRSMLDRGAEGRNMAAQFARVPKNREALRAAFPDEQSFALFMRQALTEDAFTRTRNEVLRGSPTARRLAGQEDMAIDPQPLVEAAKGNMSEAATGLARQVWKRITDIPQAQKDQLGTMLFSQNPTQQRRALQALQNMVRQRRLPASAYATLADALTLEGAALAGADQGQ